MIFVLREWKTNNSLKAQFLFLKFFSFPSRYYRNKCVCETYEAFRIDRKGDTCVSMLSLTTVQGVVLLSHVRLLVLFLLFTLCILHAYLFHLLLVPLYIALCSIKLSWQWALCPLFSFVLSSMRCYSTELPNEVNYRVKAVSHPICLHFQIVFNLKKPCQLFACYNQWNYLWHRLFETKLTALFAAAERWLTFHTNSQVHSTQTHKS